MSFSESLCEPCSTVSQAARQGNLETMKRFIQEGHPVDVCDNRGWKPTHEAAHGNHLECLKVLLEQEVTDLSWKSFEGCTALLLAAREGHIEIMKLLLQHGADPNMPDSMNEYPLLAAVKTKNLSGVKLLLDSNADVNCQLYCGTSALHQAASEGFADVVALLLDQGAKLDIREEYNITPIFSASQYGQAECLQLLLEKAKTTDTSLVNSPAEDGATPLYLASQEGHTECVQLLLDYGADASVSTSNPVALPLHAALEFNRLECVKKVLPATSMTELTKCDVSPFYLSMAHDDARCTKCLVEAGLDVNARYRVEDEDESFPSTAETLIHVLDYDGAVTPLTSVSVCGWSLQNAKILLDAGARVNARNAEELPPLFTALAKGNTDLAKLLIDHGASVNVHHPSAMGNVLILFAMHHWEGLNLVLRAGAEVESLSSPCPLQCQTVFEGLPEGLIDIDCAASIAEAKDVIERDFGGSCHEDRVRLIHKLNSLAKTCKTQQEDTEAPYERLMASPGLSRLGLDESQLAMLKRTKLYLDAAKNIGNAVAQLYFIAIQLTGCRKDLEVDTARTYLPPRHDFHKFLRNTPCLKQEDGETKKMTAFQVVQRILQFAGNVPLDLTLAGMVDKQEEWINLVTMIENPCPLAHCARLAIRKHFSPAQLLSDSVMSALPLPPALLDYVMFKELD